MGIYRGCFYKPEVIRDICGVLNFLWPIDYSSPSIIRTMLYFFERISFAIINTFYCAILRDEVAEQI